MSRISSPSRQGSPCRGSARFTHSAIDLRDQLGDDLTGDHRFNRLNPSAGVTYQFHPGAADGFSSSARRHACRRRPSSDVPIPKIPAACRMPSSPIRRSSKWWRGRSKAGFAGAARASVGPDRFLAPSIRTTSCSSAAARSPTKDTSRTSATRAVPASRPRSRGARASWPGAVHMPISARASRVRSRSAAQIIRRRWTAESFVEKGSSIPGIPRHNLKGELAVTFGRLSLPGEAGRTSSFYMRGDEANLLDPIDGHTNPQRRRRVAPWDTRPVGWATFKPLER